MRRRRSGGERAGGGKRSTIDADVGQHAAVAPDGVARQAQLAVEDGKGGSRRRGRRRIDHHIISLARSHEDFALYARNTRQRIAVLSHQAEARNCSRSDSGRNDSRCRDRAHDRGHVHVQASIDHAHQHTTGHA